MSLVPLNASGVALLALVVGHEPDKSERRACRTRFLETIERLRAGKPVAQYGRLPRPVAADAVAVLRRTCMACRLCRGV